jgi:CBS domain containing-hemolysin-like protein
MKTEIDLVLYLFSLAFLGLTAGACPAMQLLSYARPEKNGDDDTPDKRFVDRLVDDAVHNYFSLALARVVAFLFVLYASYRLAVGTMNDGTPAVIAFVAASVAFPVAVAGAAALREPERFVESMRLALYPVVYLFRPLAYVIVRLLARFSPRLLDALSFPALTFQKRIELVGYADGKEETDEQQLVSSVFEFGDTRVREVMVPRIDMVAVNIHMNPADAISIIVEAGHSRVPVFDESIDKIVGVIHTKDLLHRLVTEEDFTLSSLRRDVYFIPESKMIHELLSEFRKLKIHLAIVVDEYGGTAGLITLEDVLEELVGDIQDEFDTEEELIERIDDDAAVCNARVRLEEFNEALGLDLPEGDVDTLGGFLYGMIGRVPHVGETMSHGGVEFEIQSVVRQRIDKVLIRGLSSVGKDLEDVG